MKKITTILTAVVLLGLELTLVGQQACQQDIAPIWENSWSSCQSSTNPNLSRGAGHWIMYDLGAGYRLSNSHIWNYNKSGETNVGFKDVVVDVSTNGTTWTEHGSYQFTKAPSHNNYSGFDGPNFNGRMIRYVLITALSNWGDQTCYGLSEVRFNLTEQYDKIETNVTVPPTLYALDLQVSGNGSGHITRSIDRVSFPKATTVILTATAAAGSEFIGWSGDVSGSQNLQTVVVNDHMKAIANFSSNGILNCQNVNLTINGVIDDGNYIASSKIISDGSVLNGASIHFYSGQEIDLEKGFSIDMGSVFTAQIQNCLNE